MNTELPGYCATILQEVTDFPDNDLTELSKVPATGTDVLQNFQKSGYCGTGVQNSRKFRVGTKHTVPVPRVL